MSSKRSWNEYRQSLADVNCGIENAVSVYTLVLLSH